VDKLPSSNHTPCIGDQTNSWSPTKLINSLSVHNNTVGDTFSKDDMAPALMQSSDSMSSVSQILTLLAEQGLRESTKSEAICQQPASSSG
jgi:methanogenic corrinoid protein MtbC1